MQVNGVSYNTQNFQARLRVDKTLQNITELLDSTKINAHSGVLAKSSGMASAGASSTASGSGADIAALASAFDQSHFYPNLSYPASAYDSVINHSPESVADSVENITQRAYHSLYDPRGSAGNEFASTDSSFALTGGYFSHLFGSGLLKGAKTELNKAAEEASKDIPS